MAKAIFGGAESASAILFQPMYNAVSDYISNANQYVMERVSDIGQRFISAMDGFRQRVCYDDVIRYKQEAMEAQVAIGVNNSIPYLYSSADFVTCTPIMRQWMMVHPSIHEAAERYEFHCWGGDVERYDAFNRQEFVDYINNHDVTDEGIVSYYSQQLSYFEEHYQLTDTQKQRIQSNWDALINCITEEEVDPTDPYLRYIG